MPDDRLRPAARSTVKALVASAFAVALGATLVSAPAGAAPASPSAKPTLDQVKKKVDRLFAQAEIANERYDTAHTRLHSASTTLDALDADLSRQQVVVGRLRRQVAASLVQQYQGQSISTAGQVALSGDPSAFLDNLNALSTYNGQRGEVMTQYGVELSRLKLREKAVTEEAAQITATQKSLAADKAAIDKKAAAAKDVLDSLEAKQRQEVLSGDYTGAVPNVDASGKAAIAVRYALAQVGKAYVFGAAGPSAFDCSGLTMRAWGAAGVGLPHSSSAQQGYGTRVSEADLQPGDLVFYYSPVHHVGMYIGNGLIVNAENPSVGVRVTGVNSMPYSGAVRP